MEEQRSAHDAMHSGSSDERVGTEGGSPVLDMMLQTTGGYCVARCLHVAADLGVADQVSDVPVGLVDIANSLQVDPDSLGRVLNLLSAHGIFSVADGKIVNNDVSRTLRKDHPQSTRELVRMFGLPFFWQTFEALESSVRTGTPAAARVHPGGLWAWLAERPDASAIFNGAMTGKSFGQVAAVVGGYDFSRFPRIADIGGGRGHLLQAILNKWPHTSGVLFEQPHVIEEVREIESSRLKLQAGNFFADHLPVADAYILMEVIHDWTDDESLKILRAIRNAAPGGSTLLLVEQLMPNTSGPSWVKMLDVHMMALFAARQRTADEYHRLVEQCGFERRASVETPAGISILEYEPV